MTERDLLTWFRFLVPPVESFQLAPHLTIENPEWWTVFMRSEVQRSTGQCRRVVLVKLRLLKRWEDGRAKEAC